MARIEYGIDVNALEPENAAKGLAYSIFQIHGEADTRIPVGPRDSGARCDGEGQRAMGGARHEACGGVQEPSG